MWESSHLVWITQTSSDKHHYNGLCHILAGLVEYCTSIHMFSVCFCHCPGSGFSREDSIIAVSLEFGEEEVMELICLYFLKWHHLINSKKHILRVFFLSRSWCIRYHNIKLRFWSALIDGCVYWSKDHELGSFCMFFLYHQTHITSRFGVINDC